jgi:hypothetical protein
MVACRTADRGHADNRFEPDHITFHAGQTYELRLENH